MKLEGGCNENSWDYFASDLSGDVSRTTPSFSFHDLGRLKYGF
jgi:hypothetical protein